MLPNTVTFAPNPLSVPSPMVLTKRSEQGGLSTYHGETYHQIDDPANPGNLIDSGAIKNSVELLVSHQTLKSGAVRNNFRIQSRRYDAEGNATPGVQISVTVVRDSKSISSNYINDVLHDLGYSIVGQANTAFRAGFANGEY